jgi:hypothetical protein
MVVKLEVSRGDQILTKKGCKEVEGIQKRRFLSPSLVIQASDVHILVTW